MNQKQNRKFIVKQSEGIYFLIIQTVSFFPLKLKYKKKLNELETEKKMFIVKKQKYVVVLFFF